MSLRLRFWLFAWDVAFALGLSRLGNRAFNFFLRKCSDATDWDEPCSEPTDWDEP